MKSCSTCGSTWDDFVDFCFADGTPLVRAAGTLIDAMDAPPPPRHILPTPPPAPRVEELADDAVEPDADDDGADPTFEFPASDDAAGDRSPAAPTFPPMGGPADDEAAAHKAVRPASLLFGSALVMSLGAVFVLLVLVVWLTRGMWSPTLEAPSRPQVTASEPPPPPPAPAVAALPPVPPVPEPMPGIVPEPVAEPIGVPTPQPVAVAVPRPAPVVAAPRPIAPPAPVAPQPAAAPVSVRIESWPPGAEIRVAGVARGRTPASVPLAPGRHKVTLSLAGYDAWTGDVDARGTEVTVPPVSLVRAEELVEGDVMVFFAGRLGDALTVDGRDVGPLPVQVRLSRGVHSFMVTGVGGETFQVSRDVRADPNKVLHLHLDQ